MTPKQAIAAMRKLHKGSYHENAKWHCSHRPKRPLKPERDAARAELQQLRSDHNGEYPRPLPARVKELQSVVFASHRCTIGRLESVGGIVFLSVEGMGDTWAEAVKDATERRERDLQRYAEAKASRKSTRRRTP